jgi:hypothetical protein
MNSPIQSDFLMASIYLFLFGGGFLIGLQLGFKIWP